jgi:hypothetical protein
MPYRRKPLRKQRQNRKRNSPSMRRYGENHRQNPRMILNTIQPASYVPQSVTIRHVYDNTINLKNLQFSEFQKNYHINFVANALSVFKENGSLSSNANVTYGRTVVDAHTDNAGSVGGTTVMDDTLNGGNWANKYKKFQIMSTHYNFNIRQLDDATTTTLPEGKKLVPLLISGIRSHQQSVIANITTPEQIKKLAFTQTRFLGKSRKDNSGVVNLKVAHYPARFNGQMKNYINNPEYCGTTGASMSSLPRMIPSEKDFFSLAISPASSALGITTAVTGNLLITVRISQVVKYSEAAVGYNQPVPNTDAVQND